MKPSELLWDDLRVLLAVSETGSFLAAGRRLGASTSTVARRVETLEAELGHPLVRRTADGAVLEAAAVELAALAALAASIRDRIVVVRRDLQHASGSMAGVVRVSLGSGFLTIVAEAVTTHRRKFPETSFELVVEERAADLTRREADVGLRTSQVGGEGVVMRRLGRLRYGLFASTAYLGGAGVAEELTDLAPYDFVGYEGPLDNQPPMKWLRDRGAIRFPIRASSTTAMIALISAGQGVGVLPIPVATEHAALRPLRYREEPPEKSVYLALHREGATVTRVRAFADVLVEVLGRRLGTP